MSKHLHIVSFNVPYPADYGGIIDVFYRIKTLSEMGVKITLHSFIYGRPEADILNELCEKVYYYRRDMSLLNLLKSEPYIVASRNNKELIANLLKDNYPVLIEGLHCCSVLDSLNDRLTLVRAHNIEHEYYCRLADSESNRLKKIYLGLDAKKLEHYESKMTKASYVLGVTQADCDHFEQIGCKHVLLMPSSHNYEVVESRAGSGD